MSKVIHICPAHTEYRFCDKCVIETCQHHTKVTARGCLALDRAEGDRGCTVTEVNHYKAYAIQRVSGQSDSPLTLKGVETSLRRTSLAVREAIRMYLYVCYLDEKGMRVEHDMLESEDMQTLFDDLSKIFHELRPYMLPFLFDEVEIAKFAHAQRKGISTEPFNFRLLLGKNSRLSSSQLKELLAPCLNKPPLTKKARSK